ncbi:xanthine dehydrogenase accessory protein PucB [Bacillus rugosus]|uniref:xanthine dehydrogenase accessory protein PucB n=1 Tax=Bacillus rugosus TaxID=2715209 RepID=UPI0014218198|nr:xanthine dehydrogenase accessory protein PucB [Bacillus rugosus]MEC1549034.1 xanthine dehydrogenase accessory protein PucB [Bacillus rugosus]NUF06810.1 xanthine dehydrogenase accessory protein PucB [Bacillus rugosus]
MRNPYIIGVFLAAGKSKRMGQNKLALPLKGGTIGSLSLQTALLSHLDHVLIIERTVHASLEWMGAPYHTPPFRERWSLHVCQEAEKGQGHSVSSGVRKAESMGADGVVILLADQPRLSVDHLNALVAMAPVSFAVSSSLGALTPPIYFSSACFPYVKELKGDEGARSLLKSGQLGTGAVLEAKTSAELKDIDTPEEYDIVRRLMV